MAAIPPVCNFGEPAPDFELPATDGGHYRLADLKGPKGTVIVFMCNHCPYVKAVIDRLIRDADELATLGVATIAISSNDATTHPADSFANMKRWAEEKALPVQVSLRREPGGRPRLRRGLHARLLRLRRRARAAISRPPGRIARMQAPLVRGGSCSRRCGRWPRPAAARRSRSRRWAARSSGSRQPEGFPGRHGDAARPATEWIDDRQHHTASRQLRRLPLAAACTIMTVAMAFVSPRRGDGIDGRLQPMLAERLGGRPLRIPPVRVGTRAGVRRQRFRPVSGDGGQNRGLRRGPGVAARQRRRDHRGLAGAQPAGGSAGAAAALAPWRPCPASAARSSTVSAISPPEGQKPNLEAPDCARPAWRRCAPLGHERHQAGSGLRLQRAALGLPANRPARGLERIGRQPRRIGRRRRHGRGFHPCRPEVVRGPRRGFHPQ